MSQGETVARNATALFLSQLATWALTLLLTIFLPRYLGAEAVGQLHLAESLWAVGGILAAFGMNTLLTKEIARDPGRSEELLGASLVLRAFLYLGTSLLMAVYLYFAGYAPQTAAVIVIVGIGNLIWQFISALRMTLQGLEQMGIMAVGDIAGKGFNTAVSIVLLLLGYNVLVIAAVGIGSALLTLAVQGHFLRRQVPIRPHFDLALAGWMLRASVPYLFNGLFLVAYMQLDVIVISLLVNETVVGWYGVADRLFGTLLFIPTVFTTAVFPVLSRLSQEAPQRLSDFMSRSFNLLLLLSLPVGLGMAVIARPLVTVLFGEAFRPSAPVLALFGIVLILTYQNMLLGYFLISVDRQRAWTMVVGAAALLSIPLDLLLIPWTQSRFGNGAMGGPLAFIITEGLMMIAGLILLPPATLTRRNLWVGARALLAGGVMAATAWWLRGYLLPVPIAGAAAVYLLLVWLLQLLPQEEMALALEMWQRVRRKVGGEPDEPGPPPAETMEVVAGAGNE